MKLLSYTYEGRAAFGAAAGDGVIDLTRRLDGVSDLSDLLAQRRVEEVARDRRGRER